jgi:hypothetical protein
MLTELVDSEFVEIIYDGTWRSVIETDITYDDVMSYELISNLRRISVQMQMQMQMQNRMQTKEPAETLSDV